MTAGCFLTATSVFGPATGSFTDEALADALTMRGLRPLSRSARLAMVVAANVWPPGTGTSRDATVLGSRWASAAPLADFVAVAAAEGPDRVFPMAFPNTVASVHAGYVAALLGLTGPVVSLCGEGAGLEALVEGLSLLEAGRADRVLAVAADAAEAPVSLARPGAGEASCAVRLAGEREATTLARVTGWWVARRVEDLPCEPDRPSAEVGDVGAAGGLLSVCAAAERVARSGEAEVVAGDCGVRGAAAVRLEPDTR